MTRGLELGDKRKDRCNAKTFGALRTADEEMVESCEPMEWEAIKQPTLLEHMVETSSELEEVESLLGRLNSILFGGYPAEGENKEKEGITNIEEQSHDAKYRTVRIRQKLEDIIGRLAD